MRLFKPIWESQNRRKIERFIENPTSENILTMIAISCDFPDLRSRAAGRLTQQEKLVNVAETTLDLADLPTFLAAVCRASEFEDLTAYREITDRIESEVLLNEIARALSEHEGTPEMLAQDPRLFGSAERNPETGETGEPESDK